MIQEIPQIFVDNKVANAEFNAEDNIVKCPARFFTRVREIIWHKEQWQVVLENKGFLSKFFGEG